MTNFNKIDKASRKFKFISKSKKFKFRFLPEWVLSEANYFEKEITSPKRNNKVYKRGALVFIDFGINVGNELSGNHFGIVLNKHDSPKNGVLTVVPVSSKSNKFSVKIDGLIAQKSAKFLRTELISLAASLKVLQLHEVKDSLTEEEKIERTTTYSLSGNSYVEHYRYMDTVTFEKHVQQAQKELQELSAVQENYLKFDKVSYAKCLDIRTISKDRIRKINQFDPVGKISVSNETLNSIDKIILKNFTNNN